METNAYGPIRLTNAILPLMKVSAYLLAPVETDPDRDIGEEIWYYCYPH